MITNYNGKTWIGEFLQNRTYAAVKDDGTKETKTETINRTRDMHIRKFPALAREIFDWTEYIHQGKVVPSMRSLQFGGSAIEKVNARIYNCAFANLTNFKDFRDAFYLLMCGTGKGYSVKKRHILQLPVISGFDSTKGDVEYVVPDSKEGWARSVELLLENPFINFDYSAIRPKGSLISSGGTASGPEALQKTHKEVRKVLHKAVGRQLTPIECHDIMCYIADGVVVGGVRRAALIVLFDVDDTEMQNAKSGEWYVHNPQRARANNSAVIYRKSEYVEDEIELILQAMFDSNSGEPGISVTNDHNLGFNPCHEISLRDGGLCNLTEINLKKCKTEQDIINAAIAAAAIGTLQASYVEFPFLQEKWTNNAKEEALLGVSATGQANNWNLWKKTMKKAAVAAVETNAAISKIIGINQAARVTTTKPSGSTSAWLGCESGIHAGHDECYIRHIRMEKDHPIVQAVFNSEYPFIEPDKMDSDKMVIGFPVKTEQGTILKNTETAIELLERTKFVQENWIRPGHRKGANTHNVSLTVEYQPEEKSGIIQWMKDNVDYYAGISFLPRTDSVYEQMPFQSISLNQYNDMVSKIKKPIDYNSVDWTGSVDERMGELACANGACEIE